MLYDKYIWNKLYSQPVFGFEWDVCIILDACRTDLAKKASAERDWLDEPDEIWSVGSNTPSWYEETIRMAKESDIKETALVSGNPHSTTAKDAPWKIFDEVWRYGFNEDFGTVPPRPVTDRAIKVWQDYSPRRLLVHYMQPHLPPVHTKRADIGWDQDTAEWDDPWIQASNGALSVRFVRNLYEGNINPVLDDIEILLENIQANRVIITSDHGNYIGEGGKWSHPSNERGAPVRKVPKWRVSATEKGTHTPEDYDRNKTTQIRSKQLQALGYK